MDNDYANINVAAVAVLFGGFCVVLAEDVTPDAELLKMRKGKRRPVRQRASAYARM